MSRHRWIAQLLEHWRAPGGPLLPPTIHGWEPVPSRDEAWTLPALRLGALWLPWGSA